MYLKYDSTANQKKSFLSKLLTFRLDGSFWFQIYDDNTTYAIFCGTKQQLTIISASNILYIDVVTDGSVNGGGFNAFYTLIGKLNG